MTDETRETLWITDAELIRRIGMPEKIARARIRFLDSKPQYQFPRKSRFWGNRRYWPAVKDFFDKNSAKEVPEATDRRTMSGPAARAKTHATA